MQAPHSPNEDVGTPHRQPCQLARTRRLEAHAPLWCTSVPLSRRALRSNTRTTSSAPPLSRGVRGAAWTRGERRQTQTKTAAADAVRARRASRVWAPRRCCRASLKVPISSEQPRSKPYNAHRATPDRPRNRMTVLRRRHLAPGKEALGSAPSPSICPPFCLACLASGQQRLSLALCTRGAAATERRHRAHDARDVSAPGFVLVPGLTAY